MTEANEESVERLVCQYGHMAKPDSDYEEGDKCPNYFYCSCRDHEFNKVEIPKRKMELKEKCRAIGYVEPDEEGLEYTPHEYANAIATVHEDKLSPFRVRFDERERMAEAFEAVNELTRIPPTHSCYEKLFEFIENPWSFCLECGEVCKNNRGRKIHRSKEHGF